MKTKINPVGSRLVRIFAFFLHCLGKPKIIDIVCSSKNSLLWSLLYNTIIGNTNAGRFTNGFPNVLVTEVFHNMSTNYTLRLIPEMNFTCNGSAIVGFTVAGKKQPGGGSMDPIDIQIWRQNSSSVYNYNTNINFAIDEAVCTEYSTPNSDCQMWQFNLSATKRVS